MPAKHGGRLSKTSKSSSMQELQVSIASNVILLVETAKTQWFPGSVNDVASQPPRVILVNYARACL